MFKKLWKTLGPESQHPEVMGGTDELRRFRVAAAVGIVLVSVASAVSVLVASLYDEHGSQGDALFRQQLVTQQQAERSNEEKISQDVALFGGYEQHAFHARELRRDTSAAGTSHRLKAKLTLKARRERAIATALLPGFQARLPTASSHAGLSYDPSVAYRDLGGSATEFEDLNPGEHRLAARSERSKGVDMAGAAAFFVAALVLFTIAQVYARARAVRDPNPYVTRTVRNHAYSLLAVGVLLAIFATGLALNTVL